MGCEVVSFGGVASDKGMVCRLIVWFSVHGRGILGLRVGVVDIGRGLGKFGRWRRGVAGVGAGTGKHGACAGPSFEGELLGMSRHERPIWQ